MVCESCLPGEHHIVFHHRASSYSHLGHDYTPLPNPHVVPDLYEIVDLRPRANHRVT
jgi:hypothetical protein